MLFDDDVELALALACEELQMTRDEAIRLLVREWLQNYGFLPICGADKNIWSYDAASPDEAAPGNK
ncbi:hypothetical protein [Sinorhizobium chiapasense]|uniref:Ribbon-helix-helix protein CopG domain-containing protein n=1 Tax=Sinorhizobium chiapasense TaxID=501572 RepID=A0ABZ2BL93_9HYPH